VILPVIRTVSFFDMGQSHFCYNCIGGEAKKASYNYQNSEGAMLNIISNKNFTINDSLYSSNRFQFTTHGKFKIYLGVALAIIILLPIFDYLTDLPGTKSNRIQGQLTHDLYEASVLSRAEDKVAKKDFEGARRIVTRELDTWKEDHGDSLEGQEQAYLVLGRVAANDEEWESALSYYNKSLKLSNELHTTQIHKLSSEKLNSTAHPFVARTLTDLDSLRSKGWIRQNLKCHDAIADLYRDRAQYDKAVEEREKAVTFLEKELKEPDFLAVNALSELADSYRDANLYESEKKTRKRAEGAQKALNDRPIPTR
jgi:tetratricopeptide (TPR) repeat protein